MAASHPVSLKGQRSWAGLRQSIYKYLCCVPSSVALRSEYVLMRRIPCVEAFLVLSTCVVRGGTIILRQCHRLASSSGVFISETFHLLRTDTQLPLVVMMTKMAICPQRNLVPRQLCLPSLHKDHVEQKDPVKNKN